MMMRPRITPLTQSRNLHKAVRNPLETILGENIDEEMECLQLPRSVLNLYSVHYVEIYMHVFGKIYMVILKRKGDNFIKLN